MLLYPPSPEIKERDGFTSDNDIFQYEEFGSKLANLIQSAEQPLVLTLDGPWGSGKSTFIAQWAGLLRQRGVPVIQFDAFANDHQEDAFIALSAEIFSLAEKLGGATPDVAASFIQKAQKVGRVLLPSLAKASIRVASAGLVTDEFIKQFGESSGEVIDSISQDGGALLERYLGERLKGAQQDRETLEAFRAELASLAGAMSQRAQEQAEMLKATAEQRQQVEVNRAPLVFIIDELDRCRPPFALSVLERVKHLFAVKGVCFLLVTNLTQLEAVVRGTYGLETEARSYLDKFFHFRVSLPDDRVRGQSESDLKTYILYLWDSMNIGKIKGGGKGRIINELCRLGMSFNVQYREIERIMSYVSLAKRAAVDSELFIVDYIVGLAVMRLIRRDLYEKARRGKLLWGEAKDFFQLSESWEEMDWFDKFWRFATDFEVEGEPWVKEIGNNISFYQIDREYLLSHAANLMEILRFPDQLSVAAS